MTLKARPREQKGADYDVSSWRPDPELAGATPRRVRFSWRLKLAFWLLVPAGFIMFSIEPAGWLLRKGLVAYGTPTTAKVLDQSTPIVSNEKHYNLLLAYNTPSGLVNSWVEVGWFYYLAKAPGDSVAVHYLPQYPDWVAIDDLDPYDTVRVVVQLLGAPLFLAILLWLGLRIRRIATYGIPVPILVAAIGGRGQGSGARFYYEFDRIPYGGVVGKYDGRFPRYWKEGQLYTLLLDPNAANQAQSGKARAHTGIPYPADEFTIER